MFTRYGITRTLALLTLLLFTSAAVAGGKNETAVTIWLVIFNNPAAYFSFKPVVSSGKICAGVMHFISLCFRGGSSCDKITVSQSAQRFPSSFIFRIKPKIDLPPAGASIKTG